MVALKIENFGGMIPAMDDGLLPTNHAGLSLGAWLLSGAVEGLPLPVQVHELANPDAKRVYRIPIRDTGKANIAASYWLEFGEKDVDVVRSPTVGDSFERYYWAGDGETPQYNTRSRIEGSQPSLLLGVPAPDAAPSVSVASGGGAHETRAYVYTWVTEYGEESAPSPPATASGSSANPWSVTVTAPSALVTTGRRLATTRVYRTATATGGPTTYFFVAEFPLGILSFTDTVPTDDVVDNALLQSLYWAPPPEDLRGLIEMPNGVIAGFRGSEIWFCEPYRPHAWPPNYAVSVAAPIVGLGVVGQSLIICTNTTPYVMSGVNPATMVLSRIPSVEPCMSRGSILSTPRGVVYASPNGLILVTPSGAQIVTRELISSGQWQDSAEFLFPPALRAAVLNTGYYCFGSVQGGSFQTDSFQNDAFLMEGFEGAYSGAYIDISNQRIAFTKLSSSTPITNIFQDVWTNEVLSIQDGKVFWLDMAPSRTRAPFVWKSKPFEAPNQRNFSAVRVWFSTLPGSPELNPVRNVSQSQVLAADQIALLRVYADGRLVLTRELRESGELVRIPSGFRAMFWSLEVEARVRLSAIEFATTAKELGSV